MIDVQNQGDRNKGFWLKMLFVSLLSSILTIAFFLFLQGGFDKYFALKQLNLSGAKAHLVNYAPDSGSSFADFTIAAAKALPTVVHVKTKSEVQAYAPNPLYEFFYGRPMMKPEPVVGIGSGVIISSNGYIVTNNHVIANSQEIEVTLDDKRTFTAKLIGHDPSTDIAVIKIEGEDFPFLPYGNSDDLKVGEWVLAIGNPFDLTNTVTAGIVSAKGRNLGILGDKFKIESFIQTDAALNQGNSGGALVNLQGFLVGINTAIISPSGAYSGNSFAVPVSIVKKVVADIIEFGEVQRAILGVTIQTIDAELAKKLGLAEIKGVYIDGVKDGGSAKDAGIKEGDVIIAIEGMAVNSPAMIQEEVNRFRPKDKISVTILRDGKSKEFSVVLKNMFGSLDMVKSNESINILGADFKNIPDDIKQKLGISGGVQILTLGSGKFKDAGIKQGFIIVSINNARVNNVAELNEVMNKLKGGIYIEGLYTNGVIAYYAFGM